MMKHLSPAVEEWLERSPVSFSSLAAFIGGPVLIRWLVFGKGVDGLLLMLGLLLVWAVLTFCLCLLAWQRREPAARAIIGLIVILILAGLMLLFV
jgi:hypothetical protein